MLKSLVGLTMALGMLLAAPQPADACNIKLIGANHSPRRAVARSSRPSHVLVVADSPRLQRELAAKGHKVEVVTNLDKTELETYGAVITDPQHERLARQKFGNEHVVVLSGDVVSTVKSVESTLAHKMTGHLARRDAKDALVKRQPKDAGGGKTPAATGTGLVATSTTGAATATTSGKAATTGAATTTSTTPAIQENPTPTTSETRARTTSVAASSRLREQIYFGLGSTSVSRKTAITKAVAWLGTHAGTIVIEGHADPSGTAEANMVLSQNRADAVKDALVAAGVDASRIEVQAFGDTKLEYGRTDGRNRRVTIKAKP